ncbi:MAG: S-layer homology domain-containing protein, partial [bacterium]|nr:S-layer homology domain-containing protein [bacterium]
AYMAMEDYEQAWAVFRYGLGYGADPRFNEYLKLAREHYTGEEHVIRRVPVITRGQLASLIVSTLELDDSAGASDIAPDVESHWCKPFVSTVQVAGIMDTLPDGNFHPDAPVTWSAFYSVVHRAALAKDVSEDLWIEMFPGGLEAIVRGKMVEREDGTNQAMVSGSEAAEVLEQLSAGAGS